MRQPINSGSGPGGTHIPPTDFAKDAMLWGESILAQSDVTLEPLAVDPLDG